MIRAILALAIRRLRGRGSATLLLIAAVAAASGTTLTIAGLGTAAGDRAVQDALAALDPGDRSLRITGFAPSSDRAAEIDDHAEAAFGPAAGLIGPIERGVILRSVRDPAAPYDLQLVAVDDPATSVTLAEGQLPAPCAGTAGTACEAILLSVAAPPADLPATLRIGSLQVRIVGRGTLASTVPLSRLDERGPRNAGIFTDHPTNQPEVPSAFLLVNGVRAAAAAPGAATTGRQYFWTAPLRTELVHPWAVEPLRSALDSARATLASSEPTLNLAAPTQAIDDQLARAATNGGRLVLVGSLGVAILVAFAAYAALLGRRDFRHELERLAAAGGGRAAGALLVAFEAGIPTLAGGLLGWLVAALAAPLVTPLPGAAPAETISRLAGEPAAIVGGLVVTLLALGAVVVGLVGTAGRQALAGLVPGLLLAGGLVAWRLLGGVDVGAVGGSLDAPILALLPATIGLTIAALALLVVPRLLQRLAAAGRRFALPVRLALLSVARDPARPAATLTLLAFGLGGLVFAVADAATLQGGISDRAAFTTGGDLRVSEAGTDLTLTATVVPVARYANLGPGVEAWPVAHAEAVAAGSTPVTMLGLPPASLPLLRGWRADASSTDISSLARAIEVEGTFDVPGHQLPADLTTLRVPLTHSGDPVDLWAIIETADGDAARVLLGTASFPTETFTAPIPTAAIGGRITAILVAEGRTIAGEAHPARLAKATLSFAGLDGLVDTRPIDVEANGINVDVIRAPLATDDLVLPAIVSPDIAALAARAPGGVVPMTLAGRSLTRIRVAGVASRFPTLLDADRSFAVVALDPFVTALDGAAPGAGHPDAAWLRVDDPARTADVIATLRQPPFRRMSILDRNDIAVQGLADPFSASILAAFAAAAIAGLLLAALGLALGAAADLGDETGELRDLEAQGLGPRALRRQVGVRTSLLAVGGVVSGVLVGIALTAIVTSRIGVTADVAAPVPPLALILPWGTIAIAVAVPLLGAAGLAWLAGERAFRASARASSR